MHFETALKPFPQKQIPKLQLRAQLHKIVGLPQLEACFFCEGDIADISTGPQAASTLFALDLWKRTCFEVFVKVPGDTRYWEWNFSPEGQFGAFCFESERKRTSTHWRFDQLIQSHWSEGRGLFRISLADIPQLQWALEQNQGLEIHLSAVIEDRQGSLSYWAPAHHKDQADFHAPENFVYWAF